MDLAKKIRFCFALEENATEGMGFKIKKDLSQITTSNTTFGDGMYIVGTDIKPGNYKSSDNQGCYYARLRSFTGTLDDILANNNTDNAAIVTIYASDKGFESTNCGTWTRR